MSDLISREAAIEAIKRAIWDKYTAKDAVDAVCNIPSAQQWIPVSERLPEKNGEYLVTEIDHITCERLTDIAYHGDFICTNNGFHKTNDVVAWMPLPEPWRGEEDG